MSNFFGMRCPACGRDDQIDIEASLWVRVCENGTDADTSENGDHAFSPESPARCAACGHRAMVRCFERDL